VGSQGVTRLARGLLSIGVAISSFTINLGHRLSHWFFYPQPSTSSATWGELHPRAPNNSNCSTISVMLAHTVASIGGRTDRVRASSCGRRMFFDGSRMCHESQINADLISSLQLGSQANSKWAIQKPGFLAGFKNQPELSLEVRLYSSLRRKTTRTTCRRFAFLPLALRAAGWKSGGQLPQLPARNSCDGRAFLHANGGRQVAVFFTRILCTSGRNLTQQWYFVLVVTAAAFWRR